MLHQPRINIGTVRRPTGAATNGSGDQRASWTMKRARTELPAVVVARPRRPVERQCLTVNRTVTNTQSSNNLFTASNALTYTGGSIQVSCAQAQSASAATMRWALVIVREGLTPTTLSMTDGGTMFLPEQDVLAAGSFTSPTGTTVSIASEFHKLKSMRKMKEGDTLLWLTISSVATSFVLNGVINLFFKE